MQTVINDAILLSTQIFQHVPTMCIMLIHLRMLFVEVAHYSRPLAICDKYNTENLRCCTPNAVVVHAVDACKMCVVYVYIVLWYFSLSFYQY